MDAAFPRRLSPETLDHLEEDDPRALRSRRDLRRINRIMGSAGILASRLARLPRPPRRLIEFGAGDGSLLLHVAQHLAPRWPKVNVTLLDRQMLVTEATRKAFEQLGWRVDCLQADVLDWADAPCDAHWDAGIANLFVHHFDHVQISAIFAALSVRTDAFLACEPRRARLPLLASRLVGLIGANDVTREDAVLSVQAGFDGQELSQLWPDAHRQWQLEEVPARLFSHVFSAYRPGAHAQEF